MSENNRILSYNALLIIEFITVAIAFTCFALVLNYNEAFYVSDPLIYGVFSGITYLGDTLVYMLVLPIIYYAYDKKIGKRLAFCVLLSGYITESFKASFKDPRPPTTDEPSYGFPSGHSLSAAAYWGYIGYGLKDEVKNYVVPIITSIIIFLVALSRVIIGIHDLQDIAGGLIMGIGFLLAFIHLEPTLTEKYNALNLTKRMSIAIIVPLLLFLIGTIVFLTENFALVGGFMLGASIGFVLEEERVKYEPSEVNNKAKIINLVLGIVILLVVYFLNSFLLDIVPNFIVEFILYAVLGFVISFVSPLIFTKIDKIIQK